MWNGYPIEILGGTEVEIKDKKYNITPGIQKVLVNTSYNTAKSINDEHKLIFRDMFQNQIIKTTNQLKDVYQVVIDILKTVLIKILEEC